MKISTLHGRSKEGERIVTGQELLDLCARQRAGELEIYSLSTTKRNGFWKIHTNEKPRSNNGRA